ncbi:MAG: hypothetical protein ABFD84_13120 [Candidatus Polarisedimenticolia bacterium]
MPTQVQTSEFQQSYNSMAGADIKAVVGGRLFGELQALSYAVTREKAPIYTMGSPDPRAYSRNKRGIAGSFVWINFDRHSLLSHFRDSKFFADKDEIRPVWDSGNAQTIGAHFSNNMFLPDSTTTDVIYDGSQKYETMAADHELATPWYSDQIPPFDIVLVAASEYGAMAKMKLIGVEVLNDGLGVSIDDNVFESQSTFVARSILPFTPIDNPNRSQVGNVAGNS